MSDYDPIDYEEPLDPDMYLDDDLIDENTNDFLPNKNKTDLDNDDNENDYINENDEDAIEDPDLDNDETYDIENVNEDQDEESNSKMSFIDNELENDSKIQFILKNNQKITSNILTIYELTELIGIRATQISNGSPVFVDITNINDPLEMAKKEIINNKCPLYIKRYIGLDKYELWDPNEMIKPKL